MRLIGLRRSTRPESQRAQALRAKSQPVQAGAHACPGDRGQSWRGALCALWPLNVGHPRKCRGPIIV